MFEGLPCDEKDRDAIKAKVVSKYTYSCLLIIIGGVLKYSLLGARVINAKKRGKFQTQLQTQPPEYSHE